MSHERARYDVTIQTTDLKRGTSEQTRAFPSGGQPNLSCYSTPVSLVCGVLHWIHVSVDGDGQVHVVGGNRRPGDRYALSPVHDSWTQLDGSTAEVKYDIQDRFEIVVTVTKQGARPRPDSAPPAKAMSSHEVSELIGHRDPRPRRASTIGAFFARIGLKPNAQRRPQVVRAIDRRTIARMRGS